MKATGRLEPHVHRLEPHKDDLNPVSVLVASVRGDEGILQELESFLM